VVGPEVDGEAVPPPPFEQAPTTAARAVRPPAPRRARRVARLGS
jgi:hypothetical protein